MAFSPYTLLGKLKEQGGWCGSSGRLGTPLEAKSWLKEAILTVASLAHTWKAAE